MFFKSKVGLAVALAVSATSSFSASADQTNTAVDTMVVETKVVETTAIETIVVTANKIEQPIADVLASVSVIDRQDIENSGARDVPTLLQSLAGIDIIRKGGLGQNSSLFIRGAASSHSLVLVDGVRVGSASTGYKSISTIPLNSIERIEVVKGSRAAWYGSDALAGVINIITRKGQASSISFTTGSNQYNNLQATLSTSSDTLSVAFNVGIEKTDGDDVTDNGSLDDDGYENKNVGLNIAYTNATVGEVKFIAQFSEGYVEFDSSGDDLQEFDKYQLQLGWDKEQGKFTHQAKLSVGQDQEVNSKKEPGPWDKPSQYQTDRHEVSYQLSYQVDTALTLSGGIDFNDEDVSKSINAWAGPTQPTSGFTDESRDNLGLYLGGYFKHDSVLVNAAVRRDDNSDFDVNNTYNLSLGFPISDVAILRVTQGTGFKAPSFNNASSIWITDPNLVLLPEDSLNREVGLALTFDAATIDIALFRNDIDNLIQWTAVGPENVAKAKFEGVEVSADFSLLALDHQLNLTYLDATDEITGKDLVLRAKRSVNWNVSKQFDALYVGLQVQYRSKRASYYNTPLSAYTLVNLSANYQLSDNLTVNSRIDNLLDKEYLTGAASQDWMTGAVTAHYVGSERQFYVGVAYNF